MRHRQNLLLGAVLIMASEGMFAAMGAVVKAVSVGLPAEVVVFMRNLFGLALLLPLLVRHGPGHLRTGVWPLHLLRAALGVSAMYCFFFVLARLPLANAVLLKLTAPFFMPLVALLWLGEGVGRWALAAVPIGFVGVVLVLGPEEGLTGVAAVGLLGGFLAACAKVSVRRLGRSEPAVRTVFYFGLFAALVSAVPLTWGWQTPDPVEWGWLVLLGLFGTAGQLLLTRGYAVAPAARVGPFTYTSVVFAALFGYLFWGETLGPGFVAGATLVAVAGLLAVRGGPIRPPRRPLGTSPMGR